MAGGRERADAYHQQFAERIIQALKDGTAPWQKPWKPGERILPHNFGRGRDYRGGKAVYLAMNALGRLPPDPGSGRARAQGREGHAHHVRRLSAAAHYSCVDPYPEKSYHDCPASAP